jgi:hypothetical protein
VSSNQPTPAAQVSVKTSTSDRWLLPLLVAVCLAAWNTPFLVPLKILVVFFHEGSHALATLLTGGQVVAMRLVANQGGEVQSLGGIPFFIITAGYLGSLFWGALILIAAARSRLDRWIMAALGCAMLALTLLYMRNLYGFGFGIAGSAAALVCAKFLPISANDVALKLIGVVTMLYVPMDIFSDTLQRSHLRSDARILAEYLGGPTVFWGGLWLVISLVVIAWTLLFALRRPASPKISHAFKETT